MYPYEIIDELVPWCPGWHRNAGVKNLLGVVEKAVNAYYSDVSWKFKEGSNEGRVPYLITTDNVFEYTIAAANLSCGDIEKTIDGVAYSLVPKLVKRVYMDISNSVNEYQIGLRQGGDFFEDNGRYYANVVVDTEPGSEGTPPIVRFLSNPDQSTTQYLIDLIVGCPSLSAETIPIPIPNEFREGLIDYCQGYCQKREGGRQSELLALFEEKWKPRFDRFMRCGASSNSTKTKVRVC